MHKKYFYPAPLILLVLAWLAWMPAVSAQGNNAYIITGVDKSRYPTIQVQFRAIDLATNQVLSGLNTSGVKVFENGNPVRVQQLTRQNDSPVNIIFLIDLGMESRYQDFGLASLRDAITALAKDGFFVDGKDTVQVLARENINTDQTVPLLEPTQDASVFIDWANRFDFLARSHTSRQSTKGLQGVKEAIDAAAKLVPVPGSQSVAVIFITHFIEDPVPASAEQIAQDLAQEAMQQHISLYTFQTILNPDDKKLNKPLTILTAGSINGYTPLYSGYKIASVNAVYQAIQSQRTVYTVTYQSQATTAGVQQVTINSPQAREADLAGSYELSADELTSTSPEVTIVQPAKNSTFRLEISTGADGTTTVINGAKTVTIVADVSWPEGVQHRPFSSTELLVRDIPKEVEPEWNSDQSRVTFLLDISDIQQTQLNIPLAVKLSDGDKTIKTDITINVEVVPAPTKTPVVDGGIGGTMIWIIAGGGVVLILLVAGAIFLIKRRPAHAARARRPARNIFTRESAGKVKNLATLSVLEGPAEMRGTSIDLPKMITILGRDSEEADIVFYGNVKSSVSRVHCTIKVKAERYYLTDNGSSNGTSVNARKLQAEVAVELKNGDEIILGDFSRHGVKLRFNLTPRK